MRSVLSSVGRAGMSSIGLAWHNLSRRRARSLLAVTGIAVAVGSFVALVGLSRGMERAFVETYVGRDTHVVAVRKGAVEILTATLDETLADGLRRIDGVSSVAGELYDLVETADGESVMVTGWPESSYLWRAARLREGRLPLAGEPDAALVGDLVAAALGARSGARVTLGNHDFTVTGVFVGSGAVASKMVVVPLKTLQRLLGRDGKVTVFNLRVARPEDAAAVAETRARLTAAFPALRFSLATEIGKDNTPLKLLGSVVWATSTAALLIALFVVANTLLMAVTERRREVGVLSAVGWTRQRIIAMIALEGLVLTAVGGAVGILIGMGALHSLAATPRFHGFLRPAMDATALRDVLAAILALGVLGSAYPAWRAARLNAVDALRLR